MQMICADTLFKMTVGTAEGIEKNYKKGKGNYSKTGISPRILLLLMMHDKPFAITSGDIAKREDSKRYGKDELDKVKAIIDAVDEEAKQFYDVFSKGVKDPNHSNFFKTVMAQIKETFGKDDAAINKAIKDTLENVFIDMQNQKCAHCVYPTTKLFNELGTKVTVSDLKASKVYKAYEAAKGEGDPKKQQEKFGKDL